MISRRPSITTTALAFSLGVLIASPASAQSPPAPEVPRAGPTWQIDGALAGGLYSIRFAGSLPAPSVDGKRASGSVEATHFLAPVVDDGAPRSLQPFLQRASMLSVRFGGGGFVTSNPFGGTDRTDANLAAGAGLNIHLTRFFALTAGLGYGYDVLHDALQHDKTHTFSGTLGVGFRIADARFDAAYTFAASSVDGSFVAPRWGTVRLNGFVVIERRFTLNPWGTLLQGGGVGGLDLGFYATRDLGFFLRGFGGRGELYSSDIVVNRYGGGAGLSYWIGRGVRLGVYYVPTINHVPVQPVDGEMFGYQEVEHALSLEVTVRLP